METGLKFRVSGSKAALLVMTRAEVVGRKEEASVSFESSNLPEGNSP